MTWLREAGVEPTDHNIKSTARVIAAAYRKACLEASAAMDRVNPNAAI